MDFIDYCKTFKPEEWKMMVTDKWDVRAVVAHMVGWERQGVLDLKNYIENGGDDPWADASNEVMDKFNQKWQEYYKDYTGEQLIEEWKKYQKEVEKLMNQVGEDELRAHNGMRWVLENIDNDSDSHYGHHYLQIQKALGHSK